MRRLLATITASALGVTLSASPASADWLPQDPPLTIVNSTTLLNTGYADMALSVATGQIFTSNSRDNSTITVFNVDAGTDTIEARPDARLTQPGRHAPTRVTGVCHSAIPWRPHGGSCPRPRQMHRTTWPGRGNCVSPMLRVSTARSVATANRCAPVSTRWPVGVPPRWRAVPDGTLLCAMRRGTPTAGQLDLARAAGARHLAGETHLGLPVQVDPDGESIIVVTPGEYQFTSKVARYSTTDLTEIIRYAAPGPVVSVAMTPDGRVATHAEDGGLAMFAEDKQAALWYTFKEFSPGMDPARRGLATGAEGRFYAVEKLIGGAMTRRRWTRPGDTSSIANPVMPVQVRQP